MTYMEPADEFDGYNDLDTSTSYFKSVHISMQRLNLYDELVDEGSILELTVSASLRLLRSENFLSVLPFGN